MSTLFNGYGLGLLQATPKEPDYVSDIIKNEMAQKKQKDLEKQRTAIANRANEMHALGETQRLEKGVLPIHQQDILDAHSQFYKDVAPLKASRPYDYTYAPEYMNAEQKLNGTINEALLSSQRMRNDVLMNKKLPNQVYDASLSPRIAAIQNQDREAFLKANEGKNYYNGTDLFDRKNVDEDVRKELTPQDLTELPPIITYDKSGKMVTNQPKIYRPEVVKSKFGNYAQQNDAYLKAENNPNYQIDGKYSPQKFVDYHAGRVLPIDNYSLENPDHFYERQADARAKAEAKIDEGDRGRQFASPFNGKAEYQPATHWANPIKEARDIFGDNPEITPTNAWDGLKLGTTTIKQSIQQTDEKGNKTTTTIPVPSEITITGAGKIKGKDGKDGFYVQLSTEDKPKIFHDEDEAKTWAKQQMGQTATERKANTNTFVKEVGQQASPQKAATSSGQKVIKGYRIHTNNPQVAPAEQVAPAKQVPIAKPTANSQVWDDINDPLFLHH